MMAVVVAVTVTATVAVAITITSICLSTFGLQVLGTVLFVSGYLIVYIWRITRCRVWIVARPRRVNVFPWLVP